eukprot:6178722-Pleurochrysis_carterae.AAC.2
MAPKPKVTPTGTGHCALALAALKDSVRLGEAMALGDLRSGSDTACSQMRPLKRHRQSTEYENSLLSALRGPLHNKAAKALSRRKGWASVFQAAACAPSDLLE